MAQRHYIDTLLGEREKIVHTSRQHWFILARNILAEVVLIFLVFAGTVLGSFTLQKRAPLVVILLVGFVVLLLPILSMIRDILMWSNNQFIITNRRVIHLSGVINKNVIDSSLEKVNDVKMTQSAFGRFFNYGDIEIMTASELGVNLFRRIESPARFKTAMLNAKEGMGSGEMNAPRLDDIPQLITQLGQLRQQGTLTDDEFQQKKTELLAKLK